MKPKAGSKEHCLLCDSTAMAEKDYRVKSVTVDASVAFPRRLIQCKFMVNIHFCLRNRKEDVAAAGCVASLL